MIEKIWLRPGPECGEITALLYGDLGTILNWFDRQGIETAAKMTKPALGLAGLLGSLVAGAGISRQHNFVLPMIILASDQFENAEQLAA